MVQGTKPNLLRGGGDPPQPPDGGGGGTGSLLSERGRGTTQ